MPSKRKPKAPPFVGCTLRRLPDGEQLEAAKTAVEINPANAPAAAIVPALAVAFSFARGCEVPMPAAIASLTTKYWGAKGVKVGVGFMEAAPADLKARIVEHLNAWGLAGRANVAFRLTDSPASAEVRITRSDSGYWSYLGTDVLRIPKGQATMCLQGFTMNTSESEFRRVVRHEAGHTLGFPHEHMRREIVSRLDPARTIAYFGATQGWSPEEVRQQVLTPLEDTALFQPTAADESSIMAYQLPGTITRDGKPIPGGRDINETDAGYVARIYPGAAGPTDPGTPPPPAGRDVLSLKLAGRQVSAFLNADKTVSGTWS